MPILSESLCTAQKYDSLKTAFAADAETYIPTSTYEEARIIRVNKQQIAIPMKWFFKMKDMTIYEQWDFLRAYRLDMPCKLKTKICLDDALSKAYDLGMETDFLNMFYDMERDDPKEFKRRKNLLTSKKNKVKSSMKTCLFHSVAWYISMITDDYISLDEELQELEKQREFEADLYSFSS